MRVTFVGHAGLFIDTGQATILCDPWFNPAFFASWFPFPDNDDLDLGALRRPTYLYVSHLHRDHFDPQFLDRHVSKEAVVLLPDFPLPELRHALESLGFTRFVATGHGRPVDLDGLGVTIFTTTTPADGPLGDSCLVVDDGTTRILDQNDARPRELDPLVALAPFDAHFLQFSGAIWYPMVYRLPSEEKRRLGVAKRANQMSRALRYVRAVDATWVMPCAGPAAFLDPALFELNDMDGDPANIFVDQPAFISYMAAQGVDRGRLMVPGSVATLEAGTCTITHPRPEEEVARIFTDKRAYLEAYSDRRRPQVEAVMSTLPTGTVDIVASLRTWFEPLLARAPRTCAAIGARLVLDAGDVAVAIDFVEGTVRPWQGEDWQYRMHVAAPLVESLIARHVEDWVNELFLSMRFEAERKGSYNETVYSFFKCLSPERIDYLESTCPGADAAPIGSSGRRSRDGRRGGEGEVFPCGGYLVERRCPHLGGDLSRFGRVEDGVLTCTLHGWRFELATGRCLTSAEVTLHTLPLPAGAPAPAGPPGAAGAPAPAGPPGAAGAPRAAPAGPAPTVAVPVSAVSAPGSGGRASR